MGIFLSVTNIEFAIITGSNYAMGTGWSAENPLYLGSELIVPVHRTVDAECPRLSGRINTVTEYLSDVDKHILDPYRIQVTGHDITAVSLSYCIVIQLRKVSRFHKEIPRCQSAIFRQRHRFLQPCHSA